MSPVLIDERTTPVVSCDFTGKRILITGASRGLGQSCAEAFAKQGSLLLLTGRTAERLVQVKASLQRPGDHKVFAGDLTKLEQLERLSAVVEEFGEIDVILHVMGGGLGLHDPLLTWEDFARLFQTNLAVAAEINRWVIPRMIAQKTGNIVHVGSIASTEAVGSVGYNTIKAALAAYTRSLGRLLAPTGVIVTGVLPGGFLAPENAMVRLQQRDPKALKELIEARQPRKQLAGPDELMPLMMFLASRRATMMTGCCVPIDAGEGLTYVA